VTVRAVLPFATLRRVLPLALSVCLLLPALSPAAIKTVEKNHLQEAEDALKENKIDDALAKPYGVAGGSPSEMAERELILPPCDRSLSE